MTKKQVCKKFGNRLRQLREQKEMTQEELAHEAGLYRTYVGSIERGERNLSIYNVVRIAHALNTKPSELFKF